MDFVTSFFHLFARGAGVRHGLVLFGSHVQVYLKYILNVKTKMFYRKSVYHFLKIM